MPKIKINRKAKSKELKQVGVNRKAQLKHLRKSGFVSNQNPLVRWDARKRLTKHQISVISRTYAEYESLPPNVDSIKVPRHKGESKRSYRARVETIKTKSGQVHSFDTILIEEKYNHPENHFSFSGDRLRIEERAGGGTATYDFHGFNLENFAKSVNMKRYISDKIRDIKKEGEFITLHVVNAQGIKTPYSGNNTKKDLQRFKNDLITKTLQYQQDAQGLSGKAKKEADNKNKYWFGGFEVERRHNMDDYLKFQKMIDDNEK